MPELPEVETVRRTLSQVLLGKTLASIDIYHAKMIVPDTPVSFNNALKNKTLTSIGRLGKYLLFHFEDIVLIIHLRMEGKFFVKSITDPLTKHEHIAYNFTDGVSLRYDDVRKFGTHTLKPVKDLYTTKPLNKLGFEPHHLNLTKTYLKKRLNTERAIKTALLDQTIILGLGNIYVDEVLFCAKIKPTKKANKLTIKNCDTLITCTEKVIDKAVELGGTTIRSYTSSLGVTGRFQNELNVHTHEGEPCNICQTPIKKIKVGGRGTYYCPTCQH